MKVIIKRDGRSVKFDESKIVEAINKALLAARITDESLARTLAKQVIASFSEGAAPSVE